MPNFDDLTPDSVSQPVAPQQPQSQSPQPQAPLSFDNLQSDQDKYSTPGQQVGTVLEGIGRGIAGPLAPLAETSLNLTTPEAIRGRQQANPGEAGIGEAIGFGGGLLAGTGEAKLIGGLGELAAKALPEALPKLAVTGIRTGAEMAGLQASDELSKLVTQDPDQSLQSAAVNIGLAGIMGAAGGAAIGAVSPLFSKVADKTADLVNEAKAQYAFRKANPDLAQSAVSELSGRMDEVNTLRSAMGDLKGEALERAMPEATPENISKIDSQVQDIFNQVTSKIEDASKSVKTKSAVPFLSEDLNNALDMATSPGATQVDKYNALNKLKQDTAGYAKWGMTEEGSAKASLGRDISNIIRPALEDTSVWGEAGSVQKQINKAITNSIRAQEDLASKFTSKVMGGRELDQAKVQSLLNGLEKGKGGIKADVLNNYLEHTKGVADTIAKIHTDAGLEIPDAAKFNSTPSINHVLENKPSLGSKLGDALAGYDPSRPMDTNTLGLGAMVMGHPMIGTALIAKKLAGSTLISMAKPLLEKATNAVAARSGFEYLNGVLKGQSALNNAAKDVFKSGSMILGEHLLPTENDRKRIDEHISQAQTNPQTLQSAGSNLSHYLPDHASAAGMLAGKASQYLNSIKPKPTQISPLDRPIEPSKGAMAAYNRQLDIAQQPLLALQHAKNGTLQPQDIQTLQTLYPKLHAQMIRKVSEEMLNHRAQDGQIPYKTKQGLSMLIGTPLDSSIRPQFMQSAIMANQGAQRNQGPQGPKAQSKPSVAQQNKVNSMYATPQQAREQSKISGK